MRKIISVLSIITFIGFLYFNHSLFYLEEVVSDQLVTEEKVVSYDIKLLTIDDQSLEEVGRWP